MAVKTSEIVKALPEGTRYNPCDQTFHFRAFKGDRMDILRPDRGRVFNWRNHINQTFHDCMEPMTDRFMRVE